MDIVQLFDNLAIGTWRLLASTSAREIRLGEDTITTINLLSIDQSDTRSVIIEDTTSTAPKARYYLSGGTLHSACSGI